MNYIKSKKRKNNIKFQESCLKYKIIMLCLLFAASNVFGDENIGTISQPVRGGNTVSGYTGLVQVDNKCTGSMIGPTLILTAAHCFSGSGKKNVQVDYFAPGLDADKPRNLGNLNTYVHLHPSYNSGTDFPERANHDIALVKLLGESRWPTTDYHDYLRIYQDYGSRLPSTLDLYGRGYSTLSGNGIGTLRMARFEVEKTNKYRIRFHHTKKKGTCKGDSGGPWVVRRHNLIACVQSGGGHDGDYCGQDDGLFDDSNAYCARTVRRNLVDFIYKATRISHHSFHDGTYSYHRWFDIPFINDVDGEGFNRDDAVAIMSVIL